ncbi:lish domain and heat repeat-containing protein kiaa1468 [Plakobranchus ocellatus]|uniref:Lish domain and heat repeat-containing protein kiaa1468 n=1 Tax=Plakobranchus ocellatus TaxID=259542 RepID=A0AAV4CBV2_9GAST|nr:lish domain and heat repeat-containing protein kiaa1468 [Plakobranchus ocellatus]
MADNLNPFDDSVENDDIDLNLSTSIEEHVQSDIQQIAASIQVTKAESQEPSWDSIALKLLRDNYILTALELYTEFIEAGRDLPRLRDFFSNPGNFERTKEDTPPPALPRTSSVQTFDSLDFARYSDDGERQVDERVAVLEFELRKAQETIKSLRATLTQQAESELSTPENPSKAGLGGEDSEGITPLERKALNFLVNEYLLQADYKVTSVTFAEENEDQDFEDWDDVGLNIGRPPGLTHLFKDYSSHVAPSREMYDVGISVDLGQERLEELERDWKRQNQELHHAIDPTLYREQSQVSVLQVDLRAAMQENEILAQQVEILKIGSPRGSFVNTLNSSEQDRSDSSIAPTNISSPSPSATHLKPGAAVSVPSLQKPHPAVLEKRSDAAVPDAVDGGSVVEVMGEREEGEGQEAGEDAVGKMDTSFTGAGASGARNIHQGSLSSQGSRHDSSHTLVKEICDNHSGNRKMPTSFKQALLDVAFHHSKDNRIVTEMSRMSISDSEEVVKMLARCLPNIVPNVLLAKREELIPLILWTAILHPEPKERDQLLNMLFNLIKKPDDEQRQMILSGCVVFAEHAGAERLVEELLPQLSTFLQIGHKFIERRVLVAEACGALAAYLPAEIRSSLVLSMLQQMLTDDRDEDVREAVVKSLGLLMGFICDVDKYSQGYDLLTTALRDPKERVQRAAMHVFLPALGMWARELGRLEHHLINNILKRLEDTGATAAQKANNSVSLPLNESRFLLFLTTLEELVPLLYLTVIETCPAPYESGAENRADDHFDMSRFPGSTSPLSDLSVMAGGEQVLAGLVHRFEEHIGQEWFEPWEEINWIVNNLIPRILEVTMTVGLSMQKVVHALCQFTFRLCRTFGRTFTEKKVKLKFEELIKVPDDDFGKGVEAFAFLNKCIEDNTGRVTQALTAAMDRDVGKDMVANATKQGT